GRVRSHLQRAAGLAVAAGGHVPREGARRGAAERLRGAALPGLEPGQPRPVDGRRRRFRRLAVPLARFVTEARSYSIRSAIGVPSSTVRVTVHSRSCDFRTASGSSALALSPSSPSGNRVRKVTSMSVRRLPASSRTLSASTRISNFSGSARRDVRMSISTAVQPPIAVSRRSTGVKSVPSPLPILIWPPRSLVTTYLLFSMRSSRTPRCAESVVMPATLALAFPPASAALPPGGCFTRHPPQRVGVRPELQAAGNDVAGRRGSGPAASSPRTLRLASAHGRRSGTDCLSCRSMRQWCDLARLDLSGPCAPSPLADSALKAARLMTDSAIRRSYGNAERPEQPPGAIQPVLCIYCRTDKFVYWPSACRLPSPDRPGCQRRGAYPG